ncbi:MAG: NADPH:quinone oxidoreductase family protein [Candidatus Actinomarina sp.]|tara:strand:+ start:837 stop:1832 length:996 start_codon:yes stop_codon:yes gene_type:complete
MNVYKAWVQKEPGLFTNLNYTTMDYPVIKNQELVIETKVATLNFADLLLSSGMYQSNPQHPFVPGFEVAGYVKECSKDSNFSVGDRVVAATTVFRSGRHGSFGEVCVVSENLTYKLPENISFEVGAAILMSYLTSDFALHRRAQIKQNELVLINAAAGGVGLSAVQLAKISGARVIAAVGSESKKKLVQQFGPDLVINYQEENLKEIVEAKYGKRPIDIFYDQVGGEPYEQGVRLLASEGRALIVGFASGNIPSQLLSYLLVKNISIMGVFMISFENDDKEYLQSRMELIFDLYINQQIEPVYKTIKFDEIVENLDMIGRRETVGRIVAVR